MKHLYLVLHAGTRWQKLGAWQKLTYGAPYLLLSTSLSLSTARMNDYGLRESSWNAECKQIFK
jgi:hypothetical protein